MTTLALDAATKTGLAVVRRTELLPIQEMHRVRLALAPAYAKIPDELTGLGLINYASELTFGAGRCFLCGYFSQLVEDHCHRTGQIRAMLCRSCNTLEGFGTLTEYWDVYRKLAPGLGLHVFYRNRGWEKCVWPEPHRHRFDCTILNYTSRCIDYLLAAPLETP